MQVFSQAALYNIFTIESTCFCQVEQEFLGYTISPWAKLLYALSCICTGGMVWLLFKYIPKSMIMSRCPLSQAQYVQAKVLSPFIMLLAANAAHMKRLQQPLDNGVRSLWHVTPSKLWCAHKNSFLLRTADEWTARAAESAQDC